MAVIAEHGARCGVTALATALPAIARSLDENPLRLNLAISAYLFSLAVFIPVSGWIAYRLGTRLNVLIGRVRGGLGLSHWSLLDFYRRRVGPVPHPVGGGPVRRCIRVPCRVDA